LSASGLVQVCGFVPGMVFRYILTSKLPEGRPVNFGQSFAALKK